MFGEALSGERARPCRPRRPRAGTGRGPVTVGVGRSLPAVLELHGERGDAVFEGGLKGGRGGAVGGLRRGRGRVRVRGLPALVDLRGVGDEAVEAGGDGVLPLLLVRVAAAVHGGGVGRGGWKWWAFRDDAVTCIPFNEEANESLAKQSDTFPNLRYYPCSIQYKPLIKSPLIVAMSKPQYAI